MRRPVDAAYAGAIDHPCPNCTAEADNYCTVTDGDSGQTRIRIIPCIKRLQLGCTVVRLGYEDESYSYIRDFTEPLHREAS